ncbi:LuxR family transcriptional regulator [Caballeronia hypogeia]|uniref:LuxR family transcriptional regulator n=1 Tax=Caballeronia hypogeia TaxID=1777140 RepID=A0A158D0M3_9BURK|nr:LuxR C-terminal-related transcriptional regulator [Caballeronia hypogeia]SAK87427.1 LuxR family transcriptional regulator [Caballeronia hypogeia]
MQKREFQNSCSHEQLVADSRFAEETIEFVGKLTGVGPIAFYLVNDKTGRCDFQRHRVSDTFHRQYETVMEQYDPLGPQRVVCRDIRFGLLSGIANHCPEDQHYVRFLRAHGYSDVVETVFRDEDRLIGGLSLLLREQDSQERVLSMMEGVQPYVEFNLRRTVGRDRSMSRAEAAQRFLLSSREIDVVSLLMLGTTNNEIAESLNISIATVKTHVLKIFNKVGVPNRSTLISRMSDYGFH